MLHISFKCNGFLSIWIRSPYLCTNVFFTFFFLNNNNYNMFFWWWQKISESQMSFFFLKFLSCLLYFFYSSFISLLFFTFHPPHSLIQTLLCLFHSAFSIMWKRHFRIALFCSFRSFISAYPLLCMKRVIFILLFFPPFLFL